MSLQTPKNFEVYIVIAIVTLGTTYFNSANVIPTQDKVDAIELRLATIESAIGTAVSITSEHEKLVSHPGMLERTDRQQDYMDSLSDRLQYLERIMANLNGR